MTVTKAQVQDIQTIVLAEIQAYAFPLYGELPQAYKQNKVKFAKNVWLELKNSKGNIVHALNNAQIYFKDTCDLEIHAPNRDDLDNIYADILNMLASSDKNLIGINPTDLGLRNKYIKKITIQRN